jgi:hypothetical protein
MLKPLGLAYDYSDDRYTIREAPAESASPSASEAAPAVDPAPSSSRGAAVAGPVATDDADDTRIVVIPLKFLSGPELALDLGGDVIGEGPMGGGYGVVGLPLSQLGGQRGGWSTGQAGRFGGYGVGGGWGRGSRGGGFAVLGNSGGRQGYGDRAGRGFGQTLY